MALTYNYTDQLHRTIEIPFHPQCIISLVPSQTELLYHLGLGDRVVGITKFCIHPDEWFRSKPRVGGTKDVDIERIRMLKPDLIIGNKEENERANIEALEQEFPVWMSDVRNLDGALEMIRLVGQLVGHEPEARQLNHLIGTAFETLRPLDPPLSVAYVIWREPLMVAGRNTFIDDMLRRCGLENAFGDRGDRYVELSPSELAAADPDMILLSSEPYPFQEKHILEFNMICPGAPVRLVDGEFFSWYGSRLAQAPAYFGTVLAALVPPVS